MKHATLMMPLKSQMRLHRRDWTQRLIFIETPFRSEKRT